MKKLFTLVAAALMSASAFAQGPANAIGLYRTLLDANYYSEHKTATVAGIEVTPIMGETTSNVDLDNDENYGTSTEVARFHGTPIELENGKGRIFPITELKARDEKSFYGFKFTVPEGKSINIERLLAQAFCGNAYSWAVTISQNGTVVYDSGNLKCNGYNQPYCYVDSLNVTATSASGLSDAAKTRMNVAPFGDGSNTEEGIMSYVGWTAGNFLTDAVKNLTGEIEVKMYYFNKVKKVFSIGDLYVELSEGTGTGINSIVNNGGEKEVVGIYSVNGAKSNSLQKGLNIIKYSDGTAKKVIK